MTKSTTPLLTVGIPTWNRARYVAEGVDSLAADIEAHSLQDDVEILVSDNGSEDSTRAVIGERMARHPFVRYVRNERNMGVKFNVLQAICLAAGRYSMFLGDDDRLTEGSLAAIVARLRANPGLPALFVQYDAPDQVFKGVREDTFMTLEEIYADYFYDIGNAGMFVLDAERARRVIEERGVDYFIDNWPQTQVICLSLAGQGRPALVTNIGAVNNDLHGPLAVYTSTYLWQVGFADLFLAARDMRPVLGDEFWWRVTDYLYPRLATMKDGILFYGSLVDTPEQRRKTARSIRRLLPLLPWGARRAALELWAHVGLPRPLAAALYKARVRVRYGGEQLRATARRVEEETRKRRLSLDEPSVRENIW